MSQDGAGVSKDIAKGASLLEKACTAGSGYGCRALGSAYDNGRGVPKDAHLAYRAYRRACNYGDTLACVTVAKRSP
jgi:TPR repeat protein